MTHNQLLEKIKKRNGELCDAIMDADDKLCRPFHAGFSAIRAVVELHKPIEGYEHLCGACWFGDGMMAYPCPTIQAIQEQLK